MCAKKMDVVSGESIQTFQQLSSGSTKVCEPKKKQTPEEQVHEFLIRLFPRYDHRSNHEDGPMERDSIDETTCPCDQALLCVDSVKEHLAVQVERLEHSTTVPEQFLEGRVRCGGGDPNAPVLLRSSTRDPRTENLRRLSYDGLEIACPCDADCAAVFADVGVCKGRWMYEVTLGTGGVLQLGWVLVDRAFAPEQGIGSPKNLFAYNGKSKSSWNGDSAPYGEAWAPGDVVGCALDVDKGNLEFFRNGKSMGIAFCSISRAPELAFFPAIVLQRAERCRVNFGRQPMIHPSDNAEDAAFTMLDLPSPSVAAAPYLFGALEQLLCMVRPSQEPLPAQSTAAHAGSDCSGNACVGADSSVGGPTVDAACVKMLFGHVLRHLTPLLRADLGVVCKHFVPLLTRLRNGDKRSGLMTLIKAHTCVDAFTQIVHTLFTFLGRCAETRLAWMGGQEIVTLAAELIAMHHVRTAWLCLPSLVFGRPLEALFTLKFASADDLDAILPIVKLPGPLVPPHDPDMQRFRATVGTLQTALDSVYAAHLRILSVLLGDDTPLATGRRTGETSCTVRAVALAWLTSVSATCHRTGSALRTLSDCTMLASLHRALMQMFVERMRDACASLQATHNKMVAPALDACQAAAAAAAGQGESAEAAAVRVVQHDIMKVVHAPHEASEEAVKRAEARAASLPPCKAAEDEAPARVEYSVGVVKAWVGTIVSEHDFAGCTDSVPPEVMRVGGLFSSATDAYVAATTGATHSSHASATTPHPPPDAGAPLTTELDLLVRSVVLFDLGLAHPYDRLVHAFKHAQAAYKELKVARERLQHANPAHVGAVALHQQTVETCTAQMKKCMQVVVLMKIAYLNEEVQLELWLDAVVHVLLVLQPRPQFMLVPEACITALIRCYRTLTAQCCAEHKGVPYFARTPGRSQWLMRFTELLVRVAGDGRVVTPDLPISVLLAIRSVYIVPQYLRVVETSTPLCTQVVTVLLRLFRPRCPRGLSAADILVRFWTGHGFAFRACAAPAVGQTVAGPDAEAEDMTRASEPCRAAFAEVLRSKDSQTVSTFVNLLIEQVNYTVSEFDAARTQLFATDSPQHHESAKRCRYMFQKTVLVLRLLEAVVANGSSNFVCPPEGCKVTEMVIERVVELTVHMVQQVVERCRAAGFPCSDAGAAAVDTAAAGGDCTAANPRTYGAGDEALGGGDTHGALGGGAQSVKGIPTWLRKEVLLSPAIGTLMTLVEINDGADAAHICPTRHPVLGLVVRSGRLTAHHLHQTAIERLPGLTDAERTRFTAFVQRVAHALDAYEPIRKKSSTSSEDNLCMICCNRKNDVTIISCDHRTCECCIRRHRLAEDTCCFCKRPIERVVHDNGYTVEFGERFHPPSLSGSSAFF